MQSLLELSEVNFQIYLIETFKDLTIFKLNYIINKRKTILFELTNFLEHTNTNFLLQYLILEDEKARKELEVLKFEIIKNAKHYSEEKFIENIKKVSKTFRYTRKVIQKKHHDIKEEEEEVFGQDFMDNHSVEQV
eukprot:gene7733-12203_t